jgi:hypothetical protein
MAVGHSGHHRRGLTGLTLFVLAPTVVDGIPEFLFKITPLVAAVLAIALFPQKTTWSAWLLALAFIFYMGYIDSAFFIQIDRIIEAAIADTLQEHFPAFYTFNIFVNSFTILLAVFAYRLGGASAIRVIKLGLAGILVMISGLNDVTMWVMYPWPNGEQPLVFDWASHVEIFIGRPPTIYHMLAFLAVHLILIGLILWLPVDQWISRYQARQQLEAASPAAPEGSEPA